MRRRVWPWIAVLALGASMASAVSGGELETLEQRLREGPTVADLVEYANRSSPVVRAARQSWRAAIENRRVATAYPDPEIMFEEKNPTENVWMGRIVQKLPFPGKLSRAGEIVDSEVRVARLETDRTARELTLRIREAFHEILYVRAAREVIAANRTLLDHLRKVSETAFVGDRATLVDVTKAQSQLAQLEYDSILMDEREETETTRINALLSRDPGAPLGPPVPEPLRPLAYSLEEIYGIARVSQEDILAAEARVEGARGEASLMRWERMPDFTVGVLKDPIDEGGRDAVGFQVGMTVPLWWGKNEGRIGRAEAQAEVARALVRARMDESMAMIRDGYFRLRNADRLVRLYRDELLPQAANAVEIAETWYREGQGAFSDFIETQSAHYNFQLALARAEADYGKSVARLERLAGRSLTQRPESEEGAR
jgi:outer membrane protein TolC